MWILIWNRQDFIDLNFTIKNSSDDFDKLQIWLAISEDTKQSAEKDHEIYI